MQHADMIMDPVGTLVVVLAKRPLKGRVKTRLEKTTGAAAALSYYRELLSAHLHNVDAFLLAKEVASAEPRVARIDWDQTPSNDVATIAGAHWLQHGLQSSGNIGDRMAAVQQSFAEEWRFSRLLITGSDCPYLSPERLAEAEAALCKRDCVLVPALDGGYVMVGFSQRFDRTNCDLFSCMPWSMPQLMFATQSRLEVAGVDYCLLPPLEDVDEEPALDRWLCSRAANAY